MPLLKSSYQPPLGFSNGYVQSIYPTLRRRIALEHTERERIELQDGDFLDLDWSVREQKGEHPLVIISHGLEGHSRRPYVLGVMREARLRNVDALAWNFRSCSGEMNRTSRMYHSGAIEDLHAVVMHAIACGYNHIYLVGFSMGGNLSLLYTSKFNALVPYEVKAVAAFSVPCDLKSSAHELAKPRNKIFMLRFLRDLKYKMAVKSEQYPDLINVDNYHEIRTFKQFDDRYTAPMHGFKDANDYWAQASCLFHLDKINRPTLLVNALNDPFLTPACFPVDVAKEHSHLYLEMPKSGGHVGFILRNNEQAYWQEKRALNFFFDNKKPA